MRYDAFLGHSVYSEGKETAEIIFFRFRASKMYDMAIEIIDSLKNGNVLLIDEFDKDRVRNNTNFFEMVFGW